VFVAACGDDTPGETPDAGTTLDAGFDGAIPPRDADMVDGTTPGMDADVADGGMSGLDADVPDGALPGMDADVADGAMPGLDADVPDGATPGMDAGGLDGGPPGTDAGMDAGVDAGPPGCSPAACDDGVPCTEDVCSEDGRCVHLLLESACARGQYCDLALGCVNGAVCSTDAECADSDPCTTMERCDTSFPRRCTHRILDADADRETTTTCGGGDCNDASRTVSMMAHQVCGSAVDADCDGLVALDDLLGTTACATDILAGGVAACPADPLRIVGFPSTPPFYFSGSFLDVSFCRNPVLAVEALAACQSRATCELSQQCSVTNPLGTDAVRGSFTDCRDAFAAACVCVDGASRCGSTVGAACNALWYMVAGLMGSAPTFDICRDLGGDENNCGACGNVCAMGATCTRGTCCRPTDLDCDGDPTSVCETNSLTSNEHCGACGNACTGGTSCVAGSCVCPAGQELCGGRCVATSSYETDPMNCGGCGIVCDATAEVCDFGRCTCDYFVQNCPAGERCTVNRTGGLHFACAPSVSGSVSNGAACEDSAACMRGLECVYLETLQCRGLCSLGDGRGCDAGQTCRDGPFNEFRGTGVGYCL
jgi:hypothetical protein